MAASEDDLSQVRRDFEDLFGRLFGTRGTQGSSASWPSGGYEVPTDVFYTDDALVIRMDLPEVNPDEVEVTVQENTLLINGNRRFPYQSEGIRFVRRGTFYGDFTQRVRLGRGLDVEKITARYESGVLELRIPYSEEVQPKRIQIEVGGQKGLTE